jgi:sensor histidine kinase YesM
MTPIGRVWLLLALNASMTVVVPLIRLGSGRWTTGLFEAWAFTLVYTNVTAASALAAGPWMVGRLALRRWPPSAAVLVTTVFFAAAGCLVAQALLMWTGMAIAADFWRQYLDTLRGALLFSVVFGLGVFSYASMRDQLRRTQEKLHQKEVTEARAEKLVAEARLRSLETRLHPHFLFNTLNSISALIRIDPTRAEQMVGRLSALLRSTLDTSSRSLIPLSQELAMVEDYVEIERARFGDRLRGRIEVPAELLDAQVPPLSVQSLVENAVKHGITPQPSRGEVLVSASAWNRHLTIEVSDTGEGFDLTAIRAGHGLDSLVRRLDALFGDEARLNVSRRGDRCVVRVVLPRS